MEWKGKAKHDDFDTPVYKPRCYESHPCLKLSKGMLCGGSASWPIVADADVYVALQQGSTSGRISDPWAAHQVIEIQYGIQDQDIPSDVKRFKKMIDWLCKQLQDGKKVHVGCIGGHGRTGLVFSAIVAQLLKEKDAIQYVRAHYCKKAVESAKQVKFLRDHYGVSKVACEDRSKRFLLEPPVGELVKYTGKTGFGGGPVRPWGAPSPPVGLMAASPRSSPDRAPQPVIPEGVTPETRSFRPLESGRSLWRRKR